MRRTRLRPLIVTNVIAVTYTVASPGLARAQSDSTARRASPETPAATQRVTASARQASLRITPAEAGVRLPAELGELVDPDLPSEIRTLGERYYHLRRTNAPLAASISAIRGAGGTPILLFSPERLGLLYSRAPAQRRARVGSAVAAGGDAAPGARLGAVVDPLASLDLPDEMPPVRFPRFVDGSCTGDEPGQPLFEAKRAWALAHHHVWRAYQLLEFIEESPSQFREAYWKDGYHSSDLDFNWSPYNWFGPYKSNRAAAIREVVSGLWERFQTGEFDGVEVRVKCPTEKNEPNNPGNLCFTWEPPAHHVVKGYLNLCEGYFDETREYRAMLVAHELLHHAKVEWKGDAIWRSAYLGDTHTHADGNTCATGVKTQKMYGVERAMHLASTGSCDHREIAMRNNDNYGWFISRLGTAVRSGRLVKFPTEGVPWDTPGATGNECSELHPPPPGPDIQDPEACQKIGNEWVCPKGGGGGLVVDDQCLSAGGA